MTSRLNDYDFEAMLERQIANMEQEGRPLKEEAILRIRANIAYAGHDPEPYAASLVEKLNLIKSQTH